jgi:oligo-1,6-glucosidase
MGLVNYDFTSMNQITDVEAKGYYDEWILKKSHREVFDTIVAGTREHCRILLPFCIPLWRDTRPET